LAVIYLQLSIFERLNHFLLLINSKFTAIGLTLAPGFL